MLWVCLTLGSRGSGGSVEGFFGSTERPERTRKEGAFRVGSGRTSRAGSRDQLFGCVRSYMVVPPTVTVLKWLCTQLAISDELLLPPC